MASFCLRYGRLGQLSSQLQQIYRSGLGIAIVACRSSIMNYLIKAKMLSDSGTPLVNQKIFLHYFFTERLQQHMEKLR